MKTVILFLMLCMIAVPAQAAWVIHDDCTEVRQELSDCGQKVVDMGQAEEQAKDARNDTVAIAVAITAVVASGGTSAVVAGIGKIVAVPFILLGF